MTDPDRPRGQDDKVERPGAGIDEVRHHGSRTPVDEARATILSRRGRFITVALAGAGVVASCEASHPGLCLTVPAPPTTVTTNDGGAPVVDEPGGGQGETANGATDGGAADAGSEPDPRPRPCLTPRREPPAGTPTICLSFDDDPPPGQAPNGLPPKVCLTL